MATESLFAEEISLNGDGIWNVLGTPMLCRVRGEETGGAYSVVENIVPPQDGPPPHVHQREDEVLYVLQGEFDVRLGEQTKKVRKGETAVMPKRVAHSFRNVGETEGRLLVTIAPAGFEQFFAEVSREITAMPPDLAKLSALARKYGLEFLP